jgi:hypothetical protein
MGDREGERLEVVEDQDAFKPGNARKLSPREGPGRIGEADLLAYNWCGHGECRMAWRLLKTLQIG